MMPSLLKRRRCHWYNDNGTPRKRIDNRREGCYNGDKCRFAHPEDPEWPTARPSEYAPSSTIPDPPCARLQDSGLSAPSPTPYGPPLALPRDRVASVSSQPPVPLIAPDRNHDQDDVMAGTSSSYRRGRDHSPAPSMASSSGVHARREPYVASGARRREEEEARRRDERRREEDKRYDGRSRERDWRRDDDRYREEGEYRRDRDRGSSSPSRHRRPSTSTSARPPSHPSGSQDRLKPDTSMPAPSPPKKELTAEEKRSLWLRRVEHLSEAVRARSQLLRLQEDLQKYERLTRSAVYQSLPEEDRTALKDIIASTSAKVQEKQQELNRIAAQLIPEDFWPSVVTAQQRSDPGYHQMTSVLETLKEDVQKLYTSLDTVQRSSGSTVLTEGAAPAASKPEPGEIITQPTTKRTKKRRRLSNEGTPMLDFPIIDLEDTRDRLAALDYRIVELRNDLLQYDKRVEDEVESELGHRLSGLQIGGKEDMPADPELQARVQKLQEEFASTQARAAEAMKELDELQAYGESRDKMNADLQQKNDALRKELDELEARQSSTARTVEAQTKELRALHDAVTAYLSRPQVQPALPTPLTAEAMVETLRPRLLSAAREDLAPILQEVRKHVQQQLQAQSDQVSGDLMTQMGPIIRSVEWISAWLERIRGPTGVVTASASSATEPSSSLDKGKGVAR
ncbi:hypothetical protein BN946_scf185002.g88 [Trametes cinnabarina]|uniref:C3H1-type domain-containing protein n=1 Tax=Pycnoporus cinnabarinus TaxID=5643 RepID=A0A060SKG2_PYCCI|nr:hypothetical protein BN946_scf185002.g88 [Trametes cinnabarina]